MKWISLVLLFQFKPLFDQNTEREKRLALLEKHFKPRFDQLVEADPFELREKTDKPFEIKGYIEVNPPPGGCFIIRKNDNEKDINVCKQTFVDFSIADLDQNGRFQWIVIQGSDDSGTPIVWQTPYRLANMIKLGNFKKGLDEDVPIKSCKASSNEFQKKVVLELMNGKRWVVIFPEKEKKLRGGKKKENLFVRIMTTSADGARITEEMSSTEGSGDTQVEEEDEPGEKKMSLLALKLSGKYKEFQKKTYDFNLKKDGAFEGNSSMVLENNAPKGLDGKCRYRYTGAPNDSASGAIECFNTEGYDALYFHMTCSKDLL